MNDHRLALADEPDLDLIEQEESEAPFHIDSPDRLTWALEPVGRAAEEKAKVLALYDAALKRLDGWRDARLDSIEAGIAYLTAEITRYATENRESLVKGRTKTIDLPTGTISWRKVGGKLTVTDKEALAKWAVEQGPEMGLYRVRTEPEMAKIQAAFKATGIVPDGCDVEPERESISIKPSQPLLPKETP